MCICPHKTVLDHVDSEDKSSLECLQRGPKLGHPLRTLRMIKERRFLLMRE